MNKSILIATLAIVLIAGCIQGNIQIPGITVSPTTFTGGNGLTITEFVVDNAELYANRSAKITMTVSNKGGASVAINKAVAVIQGSALKNDFLGGDLYWTKRSTTTSVFQNMGKIMNPYDPVNDKAADEKTLYWYLTSPEGISAGTTRTDTFFGKLYYDYATTVTGNVWVYSEGEAAAAKSANRNLNQNSFTSTSGPIAVIVTVKPTNVIVSSSDNTFSMQIKVSDVGGGIVYLPGQITYDAASPNLALSPDTQLSRVKVEIPTIPTGWTGLNSCISDSLELTKGVGTLDCDVTVSVPTTGSDSSQLKILVTYGYSSQQAFSVKVSGK